MDVSARKIREGLEQAIPLGGKLTIENTPNGEGGEFHRLWTDEESPYTKVFLPWYLHGDYSLGRNDERLESVEYFIQHPQDCGELTFTADELQLMTNFGLVEDQIRWRRMKVAETKDMFLQWYPEDPVTCFLNAGDGVFNPTTLTYLAKMCVEAPMVEEGGGVKKWELPMYGEKYIMGVDAADPNPRNPNPDGDFCVGVVMSSRLRHVATLRGKWSPQEFAFKAAKMASEYNGAYIVPERNGIGASVILALEHIEKYPYVFGPEGRKGWVSNAMSKIQLVTMLKDVVDSLAFHTRDSRLISELRTFRRVDGKYRAKSGTHDDMVIALGLAFTGFEGAIPGPSTVVRNTGSSKYGWAARGK
uniref:Putative terminase n=1 Tax=viral metagenome TaxID=1070528 RepID=A0A6M3IMY0_9ZZZZ